MHQVGHGAQRASSRRFRSLLTGVLATLFAIGAATAVAPEAQAATRKVVIVVGPVGSQTANYKANAAVLARQARGYGASVTLIETPSATWSRVASAARGANVLIYLGHGNGTPSPFPYSPDRMNGLGLNASAGAGNGNTKYYGETFMAQLHLARNAVVILNRLCYASGDSEWGSANPTQAIALKRVDNYGVGFFRAGAKALFASGISSVGYVLAGLFRASAGMTMAQLFWTDPAQTGRYKLAFTSRRTTGTRALMDPYAPNRYYRSVIGWLSTTMGAWRSG